MNITFVNHASFIVKTADCALICDPWLEGTAFDNGWKLISKTKFSYEDFKDITHIWFSHEHPDHFSPSNIKKIPDVYRQHITVLFQKTIDGKVTEFCRTAGFKQVIELEPERSFQITDSLQCICAPFTDGDSWIYFRAGNQGILNINDCMINTPEDAKKIANVIGAVDILFTQFGYANKIGNISDTQLRINASKFKLSRIKMQCELFRPKFVIPFASFVWFCHEENGYMNTGINWINTVYDYLQANVSACPIILYPGDGWNFNQSYNSSAAITQYHGDYTKIGEVTEVIKTKPVISTNLIANAKLFVDKLLQQNPALRQKSAQLAYIHISDMNKTYQLSSVDGLIEKKINPHKCDVSLSAEALNYMLLVPWGGGTLNVNGRFQIPPKGNFYRFSLFSQAATLNNQGLEYSENHIRQNKIQQVYGFLKNILPLETLRRRIRQA